MREENDETEELLSIVHNCDLSDSEVRIFANKANLINFLCGRTGNADEARVLVGNFMNIAKQALIRLIDEIELEANAIGVKDDILRKIGLLDD